MYQTFYKSKFLFTVLNTIPQKDKKKKNSNLNLYQFKSEKNDIVIFNYYCSCVLK